MVLSKTELEYLQGRRSQFNTDYGYTIKCRLHRKLQQFIEQELPILIEKGYLTDISKPNLTVFCKKDKSGPGGLRSLDLRLSSSLWLLQARGGPKTAAIS